MNPEHEQILRKIDDLDRRLKIIENLQIVSALHAISAQLNHMERQQMADAQSILAKITANNDKISSFTAALVALSEGQADIKTEIQNLKDQIAAGQPPDFGPLDAAADQQTTLVQGAAKAVDANT